jgi:hypothetical protein
LEISATGWPGQSPKIWGPIWGSPGSGKTTFIEAFVKVMQEMGNVPIVIRAKDCDDEEIVLNNVDETMIVKKISTILQFTANDTFKPSFDVLMLFDCSDINCLMENAEKELRSDIAKWIITRLKMIKKLIDDKVTVPLCLQNFDEGVKRVVVGVIYAMRHKIPRLIIIDDSMAFIVNRQYYEAFLAMMRPAIISNNRLPVTEEMLMHNLNVLTPDGSGGVHRLTRPDKYVVLFGHSRWEIPRREIERLANS